MQMLKNTDSKIFIKKLNNIRNCAQKHFYFNPDSGNPHNTNIMHLYDLNIFS